MYQQDRKIFFYQIRCNISLTTVSFNRSLPSPIIGLSEIEENSVVTVRFRDPKYPDEFIFKAEKLPGAVDPPTVLAAENRSNDYRPQIGTFNTKNYGKWKVKILR